MNKIININLGGRLIPIDEKAYDQLSIYIGRLKSFFLKEAGGDEILRDMEDRIGELLQDKLKRGQACILSEHVDDIISIMGSPEEIESETGEEIPNYEKEEQTGFKNEHSKKLYRNANEKVLGGVCGGVATYFNIDPAIVRIVFALVSLMWGSGIIIYLILWALLPESETLPSRLKRRLYRNPDQKVIGGVCSGIAAYFNIDPIIPRLLFVFPLLGLISFGIINSGFWLFPLSMGAFPTSLMLYCILWAALPKASSVAEKLEMRGEKVDFQNLSQAVKDIGKKIEEFPKKNKSDLERFATFIGKILVFFFLSIILLVIGSIFIAILAALLGFATSSFMLVPFGNILVAESSQQTVLWISLALVILIPLFACIRGLIKIISGRKNKLPGWLNFIISLFFIGGIFGLFWIGSSIMRDFKIKYTHTEELPIIQPLNDTLIIKNTHIDGNNTIEHWDDDWKLRFLEDSKMAISNISFHISESPDSLFHLYSERSAYGNNSKKAQQRAMPLNIDYHQEGNTLFLPEELILSDQVPFRGQQIHLKLEVPKNAVFRTENIDSDYYTYRSFSYKRSRISYKTRKEQRWENGQYYKIGERMENEEAED